MMKTMIMIMMMVIVWMVMKISIQAMPIQESFIVGCMLNFAVADTVRPARAKPQMEGKQ